MNDCICRQAEGTQRNILGRPQHRSRLLGRGLCRAAQFAAALGLLALAMVFRPAAASGQMLSFQAPTLSVQPASGTYGTLVTARGSGFPANTRINLYLSGLVEAQAQSSVQPQVYAAGVTDASGRFVVSFGMPDRWPDGTPIETGLIGVVAATSAFESTATATFQYIAASPPTPTPAPNPYVTVRPASGGGNVQVRAEGGGFPPGARVYIHLGRFDGQVVRGDVASFASTTADSGGAFRTDFVMPTTWPDGTPIADGPVLVIAATQGLIHQAGAVYRYAATAPPTPPRNPSARVVPDQGPANTLVTVTGSGFPPSTRVNVHLAGAVRSSGFGRERPYSYASAFTDAAGNAVVQFYMPSTWPDGKPIASETLSVVMATEDLSALAGAAFEYTASTTPPIHSWRGQYWSNPTFSGLPVFERQDSAVNFDWGGGSPDARLPNDRFSVRWSRSQTVDVGGTYRFTVEYDDGVRLWVDRKQVLADWAVGSRRTRSVDVSLAVGIHEVVLEYFEETGDAVAKLRIEAVTTELPAGVLFDDDPRNNRRKVNQYFCSGFDTECNFAGCPTNYRIVWGPFCRETDHSYIEPGKYRVTIFGTGNVVTGATDYGASRQMFSFGRYATTLPAAFEFCWPGLQSGGTGFETIVQSTGTYAAVDRIRIEYLGSDCR